MNALTRDGKLARVLTAMVTPFAEDLSVDYRKARALARRLSQSGSDGSWCREPQANHPPLAMRRNSLFEAVLNEVGNEAVVFAAQAPTTPVPASS